MVSETIAYFKALDGPFMQGKTALINGADDPIGFAIAQKLIQTGAFVYLCCEQPETAAYNAKTQLPADRYAIYMRGEADTVVIRILQETGRLDILVNNPECYTQASIEALDDATIRACLEDSAVSTLQFCRAAAVPMKKQKEGRIINLGHFVAKSGSRAYGAHFAAARTSMLGITKELTSELFVYDITVNAVAPGVIAGCQAPGGDISPVHVPLGRQGSPEDVANAVVFLASSYANFITGACLDVNGGAYMD